MLGSRRVTAFFTVWSPYDQWNANAGVEEVTVVAKELLGVAFRIRHGAAEFFTVIRGKDDPCIAVASEALELFEKAADLRVCKENFSVVTPDQIQLFETMTPERESRARKRRGGS